MAASIPLISIRIGPKWMWDLRARKQGWAIMTYRAEISALQKKSLKKVWDLKSKNIYIFCFNIQIFVELEEQTSGSLQIP